MYKANNRKSEYPIDPFFLNRWSPRAFSTEPIADETVLTILESAHWAPSCFNEQPCTFIIANTAETRNVFYEFLVDSNRLWADKAPVLIAIISKKNFARNGKVNAWHSFDCGTAWGYLTMEAYRQDLITHCMGGFKKDLAAKLLEIPEDYQVEVIIALGKHADLSVLPAELQEQEVPSGRKALQDVVFTGKWTAR
ncbi:hypothetical protein BHU72_06970 [Desulfuribacillus stibiiarsenatis]|uniref:Nitroreductase domain-containing protein n=1 Tax=Desulfuribacillus stibiiarsenatis TaxID=1390249 RepID=A0A1E5L483_9FIRM|nr:nitroreductase family protein [Desulfuribacillus stibiiarsenatis]OEH84927.1 hypothetical protein BHU72_06970 [Desulfuribacillus stibiiarsenatis]